MRALLKYLSFLWPLEKLSTSELRDLWFLNQRADFIKTIRVFFLFAAMGYIFHYHTVDALEGLAPSQFWFSYRYGVAFILLLSFAFYSTPTLHKKIAFYRIPTYLVVLGLCYLQARSCVWYSQVSYVYSFIYIVIGTMVLRLTPIQSAGFALLSLFIILPTLVEIQVSFAMLLSGSFLVLTIVTFLSARYQTDIEAFIVLQERIYQQKQVAEINRKFSEQIKAFLPKEIMSRLPRVGEANVSEVTSALRQQLVPQKKLICCLYSDIRGFTKSSKDLSGFVADALFPEVSSCADAIEQEHGILRKVGDLIFAYYDKGQIEQLAIKSAMSVAEINRRANDSGTKSLIHRFVLLSKGEAVVGNLGGENSMIEITAIGPPVNLLSRIDELTKQPKLQSLLKSGDILFCEDMVADFSNWLHRGQLQKVDLTEHNLRIRDFSELHALYIFRLSQASL